MSSYISNKKSRKIVSKYICTAARECGKARKISTPPT
jgi:hypothetical protein